MFTVIYRSYVIPGREEEYKKLWHQIANYFVNQRGAIGSMLNYSDDGYFLAYSRWPDRATRDASWPGEKDASKALPLEIQNAIKHIKLCADQDRPFEEITMTLIDAVSPTQRDNK